MFFPNRKARVTFLDTVGVARVGKASGINRQLGAFGTVRLDLQFGAGL
jgi:hypothetical protein